MEPNTQRWTAGKRIDLVVSIPKQEETLVDACRENDLKQSEVKNWIDQCFEDDKRNPKVNSKGVEALQRKVGELVLENDVKNSTLCTASRTRRHLEHAERAEVRRKHNLLRSGTSPIN